MNALATIQGTVLAAAPLILAAMGGWASERSGVINIALEGKMLMGCVFTVLGAAQSGNAFVGLSCGLFAAVAFSLAHWVLTQRFRVDQIVSGMAANAIAFGLADTVKNRFIDTQMTSFSSLPLPFYWITALVLPFGLWLFARRTRPGLHLIATGESPEKARQMGLSPRRIRFVALAFAGVFCGLAGALLSTNIQGYTNDMTAGRGFIALAALIVGGWRPLPTLVACLAVGFLQQLRIELMGSPVFGIEIPNWIWLSLPYLVTVIALAGFLGRNRTPSGLGKP